MTDTRPSTESTVGTGDSGGGERRPVLDHAPGRPGGFIDQYGNEYVGIARFHELHDDLDHAHQELRGLREALRHVYGEVILIAKTDDPDIRGGFARSTIEYIGRSLSPAQEGQEPEASASEPAGSTPALRGPNGPTQVRPRQAEPEAPGQEACLNPYCDDGWVTTGATGTVRAYRVACRRCGKQLPPNPPEARVQREEGGGR